MSFCRLLALVIPLLFAACKRATPCTPGAGIVMIVEPKVGSPKSHAPALAKALEGKNARLVASERVLAVFATDTSAESFQATHETVVAASRAQNLELTIEDTATIDAQCNIRREHDPEVIAPAP